MYAYDIACIKWKTFVVYTPIFKDNFSVEKVWVDKLLGNYVIIKNWDLRFIYWHTETNYKGWETLKWWAELGWASIKNGKTENYHLHIELWKNSENISWGYIDWKGLIVNAKSTKLLEQRGFIEKPVIANASEPKVEVVLASAQILPNNDDVLQKAFEFITKKEWFRSQAYWDISHFSIWYGTDSYAGETITEEEAIRRSKQEIQSYIDKYNLSVHPANVQVAVVSFVYNIGSLTNKQKRKLNNKYYNALGNDFLQYKYVTKVDENWNKVKVLYKWLENRRIEEDRLIKSA